MARCTVSESYPRRASSPVSRRTRADRVVATHRGQAAADQIPGGGQLVLRSDLLDGVPDHPGLHALAGQLVGQCPA